MVLTEQIVAEAIRVSLAPKSQSADFIGDAGRVLGMLGRREAIAQELAKVQLRVTGSVNGQDCESLAVKLASQSDA